MEIDDGIDRKGIYARVRESNRRNKILTLGERVRERWE